MFLVQRSVTCTDSDGTAPNPIPVTIVYNFTHCDVYFSGDGRYTETVFRDGSRVTALPEVSDEYRAKARLYGYGDDCNALSREHEFLHTYLAERLRGGASHALWAVAHHQQEAVSAPVWVQEEEEELVLDFQQFINGAEPSAVLLKLQQDAVDIDAIKKESLRLMRSVQLPL